MAPLAAIPLNTNSDSPLLDGLVSLPTYTVLCWVSHCGILKMGSLTYCSRSISSCYGNISPFAGTILNPLSRIGLWDAVTTTPTYCDLAVIPMNSPILQAIYHIVMDVIQMVESLLLP
jgi:hypothetical protein